LLGVFAGAVIALGSVACGGGDGDAPATPGASETAAPSGSATTTPTAVGGVTFLDVPTVELTAGRSELPADLALIVVRDGELRRFHRAPDGSLEERLLFDPFAYSSTRLLTYTGIQASGPMLPPGLLVITACSTGECPALGAASEDALATVFESVDGGGSWHETEEIDGVARVVTGGATSGEFVLQRLARDGDSRTGQFEFWPSGQVLDPPENRAAGSDPAALPDGRLLWWQPGGDLVDSSGNRVLALGEQLTGGSVARGLAVLPNSDGNQLLVTWQENPPEGTDGPLRWSVYTATGDGFELARTMEPIWVGVPVRWLSGTTVLTTAELDFAALGEADAGPERPRLPVVVDVVSGTATAIDVPGGTLGEGWAIAAQFGPFAEINAGEGDCLNLRTEASTEGTVLDCIAHGALVERLSPLDGEWVNVRTSDGRTGWVSGEFVRQQDSVPASAGTATATATGAAGN